MEENLEKFIRNNKAEFNYCEPPTGLWEKIAHKLDEQAKLPAPKVRVVRISILLKIAASVMILLAASTFLWQYQYRQATDVANIDKALAEQQVYFTSVIESKRIALKSIEKEQPQLYHEFSAELKKMDDSYKRLKADLANSPNQEETLRAMIRNLQVQSEVLNQQLIVIEQINDSKKERNDENQTI